MLLVWWYSYDWIRLLDIRPIYAYHIYYERSWIEQDLVYFSGPPSSATYWNINGAPGVHFSELVAWALVLRINIILLWRYLQLYSTKQQQLQEPACHDDPFFATELAQQNLRQQSEDEFDIQLSLLWINDSIEYE